ncbi:MAG: signal peptidase I [bacterium]
MNDLYEVKLELVANQLLSGQTVKVRASGHSMTPFIHDGDLLTLHRVRTANLQPGEIVAFIRNGLLFIHRIIEVSMTDEMVLTKGDNLLISDKLLKPEEVLGSVIDINDISVTTRRIMHHLFFQLYRFCLLAGNVKNAYENHRIVQLSMDSQRFRMCSVILRVYRFFVFL